MPDNRRLKLCYDLRMEANADSADIMIYSAITSWKWDEDDPEITAREFDKLLKQAKSNGVKTLNIRINSPGGAVYQAIAMRTMLMTADFEDININIEGLCASAATLLTCIPGRHVTMAEGSSFMIHNPRGAAYGTARDMRKEADVLTKMEADLHGIYAGRANQTEEQIASWMDDETWFTAKEAREAGFVDEVLGEEPAAASVDPAMYALMREMYAHTPDGIPVREETAPEGAEPVSNAEASEGAAPSGGTSLPGMAAENIANGEGADCASGLPQDEKEERNMEVKDIKDITMEQLRAENPAVIEEAIKAERERVAKIDKLTPAGYEALAEKAKKEGTTPVDFVEMLVEAQKKKGADFMENRQSETQASAKVEGGSETDADGTTEEDEMKAFLDGVKDIAGSMSAQSTGMY